MVSFEISQRFKGHFLNELRVFFKKVRKCHLKNRHKNGQRYIYFKAPNETCQRAEKLFMYMTFDKMNLMKLMLS